MTKVAIVTGASRGVGEAIVRRFVQGGYYVVATARSKDLLQVLAAEYPDHILPVACDITNSDQVTEVINQTIAKWGKLDILINNAGIGHFAPVEELTEDEWDEMLAVNSKGPFLACKYAIPHLKASEGHIVNISSIAGIEAFARGAGYCASKFALMALSDVLTKELKPHHVKVSIICPGSINTTFHNPKDWALPKEQVAETTWMIVSAPKGVIYSQVNMRPLVP
jgi:NAD(P)-dependent dehydrogenase (short-subunit alcohol dehydrogenase family)